MEIDDFKIDIISAANAYKLDDALVSAIIMVESAGSGWNWATRFEGQYAYVVTPQAYAKRLGISIDTERMMQKTSWGLMQCMGATAREMGFLGALPMLTEIDLGLKYGCKKLSILFKLYPKDDDAVAAYNLGSPKRLVTGEYVNQDYVDKVKSFYRSIVKGIR
jgi:hypothetical protein